MAYYTPTVGIITNISAAGGNDQAALGCSLLLTVQSEDQGVETILLPGNAYVLNSRPLKVGERVTFFYDPQAPSPLVYPPQHRAVAAAHTPYGTSAALDFFNALLTGTDGTMILNMSADPQLALPNGQPFYGDLSGKLLLVTYSVTTRSVPAQARPDQIVVFCAGT